MQRPADKLTELQKPTADGTQENLLDRLETRIYQTSMVANISDESYGNATSRVALAYKLQAMSNLALGFDRKIEKSLRKRYKIFCSLSTNVLAKDAWKDIKIQTTRNIPNNRMEEAQMASQLSGIVSHKTQLSVLSIVDDPDTELQRIEEEDKGSDQVMTQYFQSTEPEEIQEPQEPQQPSQEHELNVEE